MAIKHRIEQLERATHQRTTGGVLCCDHVNCERDEQGWCQCMREQLPRGHDGFNLCVVPGKKPLEEWGVGEDEHVIHN
ncbi:MAG: hypothetical protein R3F37_07635 [Candidatus Competibacteraceae bacterium]